MTPSAPSRRASFRRLARRVVVFGGVCYITIVALMMLMESTLVYRPFAASTWREPTTGMMDVQFRTPDGQSVHGWWYPVAGQTEGAVLFCHGNMGNVSVMSNGLDRFGLRLNRSVLNFDYPGYGRSEGSPSEAGCVAAGEAALSWLTGSRRVPLSRIVILGDSLGGGVAVELAARHRVQALVVVRTFTSLPDVAGRLYPWIPTRLLMRNRFPNIDRIGAISCPVFIAHGTADGLIPFTHGQALFDAANEPKRFWALEGDGHDDPLPPDFPDRVKAFLEETAPEALPRPRSVPRPVDETAANG